MNIICNNCVGARIYQILGLQFNNPFMWSLVSDDDFIYLINHWEEIDFEKFEVYQILDRDIFELKIDGKVKLRFIHHHLNPDYQEITKEGVDVYYNSMESYIIETYLRRLNRMNEKPTFVISNKKTNEEGFTFLESDLHKIDSKTPVIFCGEVKPEEDNIIFVKIEKKDTIAVAKEVIKTLKFE